MYIVHTSIKASTQEGITLISSPPRDLPLLPPLIVPEPAMSVLPGIPYLYAQPLCSRYVANLVTLSSVNEAK